jgi:hypothetical protein
MNELDRRIAELKGWKWIDAPSNAAVKSMCAFMPPGFIERRGNKAIWHSPINCDWSTSDTKAFELVDELQGKFALELKSSPSGLTWSACFKEVKTGFPEALCGSFYAFTVEDVSRPEAICRAYIAAKEYILKHGT